MKNCNEIRAIMSLYIDKELGETEAAELEEHIKGCSGCKRELNESIRLIELCRALPDEELPLYFKEQLHEKLTIEKQKQEHKNKAIVLRNKYIAICSSIAAVLLVAVLIRGFSWNVGSQKASDSSMNEPTLIGAAMDKSMEKNKSAVPSASPLPENNSMLKSKETVESGSGSSNTKSDKKSMEGNRANGTLEDIDTGSNNEAYSVKGIGKDGSRTKDTAGGETGTGPAQALRLSEAASAPVSELKNISVAIKTSDPEGAMVKIRSQLDSYNAIEEASDYSKTYTAGTVAATDDMNESEGKSILYIKVPDNSYEGFINYIKESYAVSGVELGKISSVDISKKISDFENKLKELHQKLEGSSDDAVEGTSINKDVESEISRIQAELDKLKSYIGYTIVTITINK